MPLPPPWPFVVTRAYEARAYETLMARGVLVFFVVIQTTNPHVAPLYQLVFSAN